MRSCRAVLRVLGVSTCPSSVYLARAIEREDVCVSGGTSPTVRASKRVSPHGPVLRRRRCFGRVHLMSSSAGAVSLGEEWSRPQLGRSLRRASVSSRFSPELADTQPHPSRSRARRGSRAGRNLVDPASSHMLVSKIKPCMSQYKLLYGETANGSLKQL